MVDPLAGIGAKLDRAEQHLHTLDVEIPAWAAKEQPYSAVHDYDPRKRVWIVKFRAEPTPPCFSVIFGEAVHNMRSALDHLVSYLVEREGGKPTKSTAFPVLNSRGQWRNRVERRKFWLCRKEGSGPLKGLVKRGDAWTLIERAQPYQRGKDAKDHPLLTLEDLWNRDKHRALNPCTWLAAADGPEIAARASWEPPITPELQRSPISAGDELKNGTKLLILRFPPGTPPKVKMPGPLPITPRFGSGKGEGDIFATLTFVRRLVDDAASL